MDDDELAEVQQFFESADYDNAIRLLKAKIAAGREDWNTHFLCGFAFRAKGDFESATAYYEFALKLEPESETVLNALGIAYQHTGRLDDAELCFRTALAKNPKRFESLNSLAITVKMAGRYHEALNLYQRAVELCVEKAFNELRNDREQFFAFEESNGERLLRLRPAYFEAMRSSLATDLNYFTVVANMGACYEAMGHDTKAAEMRAVAESCTPIVDDLIGCFRRSHL